MKNKVLVITSGSFPFGSPRAIRLRAFAKMFQELGWDVCLYSDDINGESEGKTQAEFQGIKLYSIGKQMSKIEKLSMPLKFLSKTKEIIEKEKPNLLFATCLYDRFALIMHIRKKYNIPLVIDSSEWYDPSTFPGGRMSWQYNSHLICWNFYYPKVDGVIAISRLLERHYLSLVKNTIRIPTIVPEAQDDRHISIGKNGIKLLFAGVLGKTKDSIKQYFEALDYIDNSQNVCFEICGVTLEKLKEHIGEDLFSRYKDQINVHGVIAQEKVIEMYQNADFGIFFRPNQRSSHAGFATKLGEGMSAGTPFIINDTSDISLYIDDGENGFIVNDVEDIANVYKRIFNMSLEERENMRKAARRTAMTDFFYATYLDKFGMFLKSVIGGHNGK